MLTLDDMRRFLKDHNRAAVAKSIGVSYITLYRFMRGDAVSLRVYEKLNNYIESSIPGNKADQ